MTIGKARKVIRELAPYRPGESPQHSSNNQLVQQIKLSSNESPFEPLPAVLEAAKQATSQVNRYPDHHANQLRHELAQWLKVDPATIAIGAGSSGLLQQIVLTYIDPGDEVVYPWLSFEAYPLFVHMMAGNSVQIPLKDHTADLADLAKAVNFNTKLVFIANPNNPTGTAVSTAQLDQFMQTIPNNVIVVLDEAYHEFAGPELGDPIKDLTSKHGNLVITRTFSKAYGLAGMRIGYALANPDIVTELNKVILPFAVNHTAQAAATAAIETQAENQVRIDQLIAERNRVAKTLDEAGWQLPESHSNFLFLPTGDRTDEVFYQLRQSGILTRPFQGTGIRVTMGTPEENDILLSILLTITL